MSIRIWDPFGEIENIQNEVTRLLAPITRSSRERGIYAPLTDLYETDEAFIVKVDLPGISKENLEIEATGEYLEINAKHETTTEKETEETTKDDEKCVCKERFAVQYNRRIAFPTLVDPSKANVKLENGVLEVTMPKSEQAKAVKLLPN